MIVNKKNILAVIIVMAVLIACIIFICINKNSGEIGLYANIRVSGKTIYTLNLKEKNQISIDGANNVTVNIKTDNGYIWVEHSECPDKICEKTGKISHTNENIICLPAETVIEIHSSDNGESEVDIVA